ncbi:MAG: hypothetical protein AAF639_10475 [Chloroflexota bacterium]
MKRKPRPIIRVSIRTLIRVPTQRHLHPLPLRLNGFLSASTVSTPSIRLPLLAASTIKLVALSQDP